MGRKLFAVKKTVKNATIHCHAFVPSLHQGFLFGNQEILSCHFIIRLAVSFVLVLFCKISLEKLRSTRISFLYSILDDLNL